MPRKIHHLTARDRQILEFIARYRLATDDILWKQFFADVQDHGPVRKVASRLVERNYLREFTLRDRVSYYVLAPRGCRALEIPAKEARPFTEQSLPAALAIAYFCVAKGVIRYTAAEFRERFPKYCRPGLQASAYFLENLGSQLCLNLFLIDRGVAPKGLLRKIAEAISKRYQLREFARLIQNRRFRIVVLTGLVAKQRDLEKAISEKHRGPAKVLVEVVPELGTLLTQR